jgi:hypothetical protein
MLGFLGKYVLVPAVPVSVCTCLFVLRSLFFSPLSPFPLSLFLTLCFCLLSFSVSLFFFFFFSSFALSISPSPPLPSFSFPCSLLFLSLSLLPLSLLFLSPPSLLSSYTFPTDFWVQIRHQSVYGTGQALPGPGRHIVSAAGVLLWEGVGKMRAI